MVIPFPKGTPSLQDLVFEEAADLLKDKVVHVYDGFYSVGKHCSIRVTTRPLPDATWGIELTFQAFEAELVDWSKIRLRVNDHSADRPFVLRPLSTGTAGGIVAFNSFDLGLFGGTVTSLEKNNLGAREGLPQKTSQAKFVLKGAIEERERSDKDDTGAFTHLRNETLWIDLWVRQFADQIQAVVVAPDPLPPALMGAGLLLLFVSEETGQVLDTQPIRPLERQESRPEIVELVSSDYRDGEPCWYRYEEYRVALKDDCFIEVTRAE